jgi:hypothetical protein
MAFQVGGGDDWVHLGTAVAPEDQFRAERNIVRLGDLALVSHSFDIETIKSPGALVNEITHWRTELGANSRYLFQEQMNIERWSSHGMFMESPAWRCSLYEKSNDSGRGSAPRPPFFHPDASLFAASLADLTEAWLRFDRQERVTGSQDYLLVIPDRRAWFTEFDREEEQVVVTINNNHRSAELFCAFSGDEAGGGKRRGVATFSSSSVAFDFPPDLNSVEFYLLTRDGEVLDTFSETAYGRRWGKSVLRRNRPDLSRGELHAALLSGETDTVEFKSAIDCSQRDTKSFELIETATAFANTSGGAIYVGISDHAEPVGVSTILKKRYAGTAQGDYDKMKKLYVDDLRKLLTEGIAPSLSVEFEWLDVANLPILRIRVPCSESDVYATVENGQFYLRAGATNRKVRGDDMLDLMARRRPVESNLAQMVYRNRQGGIY